MFKPAACCANRRIVLCESCWAAREAWRNGLGSGTKDTMPYVIWSDEVRSAAIAQDGEAEQMHTEETRRMLGRAWNSGEPVWMAAEELAVRTAPRRKLVGDHREQMDALKRMGCF